MYRIAVASLVFAGTVARGDPLPPAAAPSTDPPVAWSVAAGLSIGILSLAIGGGIVALDDMSNKETGTYVIMSGLILAPAVSHLIAREWDRAAIFSALPAASMIAVAAVLAYHPTALTEGMKNDPSVGYALLLSIAVMSSTVGVIDSLWAGERARKRHPNLTSTLAPIVTRDHVGLALGGIW